MSAFGGLKFTQAGIDLQSKAQIGTELQYTRIGIGDGHYTGDILDITKLVHEVLSLPISSLSVKDGQARIGSALSNQDLQAGFYLREIGVYAVDPDEGEILYCYANAGEYAGYVPPAGGADPVEKEVELITIVGTAANVTAVIDTSVFATLADVDSRVSVVQDKLSLHTGDADIHVTAQQKNEWDAKQESLGFTPENIANKGATSGYAPLDNGAKVPTRHLPDSILGQVEYISTWNADTDTPELPDAVDAKGSYYVTETAGVYQGIEFKVGDWVISNGIEWQKVDNTDAVPTVFGRTGNIVAAPGDYAAGQISLTPAAGFSSTDVQGAINEISLSFDRMQDDYNRLEGNMGLPVDLETDDKSSLVAAINEVFTNVSDLKTKVAAAVTDKGVPTSPDDDGDTMAANIKAIQTGVDTSDATATAADILAGETAYADGEKIVGTLVITGGNATADDIAYRKTATINNPSGGVRQVTGTWVKKVLDRTFQSTPPGITGNASSWAMNYCPSYGIVLIDNEVGDVFRTGNVTREPFTKIAENAFTGRPSGPNAFFRHVAESNGTLVAVSFEVNSTLLPFISDDGGVTWTKIPSFAWGVSNIYKVLSTEDYFVALTNKGIALSSDGSVWNLDTSTEDLSFADICIDSSTGRFFAISSFDRCVYTSRDASESSWLKVDEIPPIPAEAGLSFTYENVRIASNGGVPARGIKILANRRVYRLSPRPSAAAWIVILSGLANSWGESLSLLTNGGTTIVRSGMNTLYRQTDPTFSFEEISYSSSIFSYSAIYVGFGSGGYQYLFFADTWDSLRYTGEGEI